MILSDMRVNGWKRLLPASLSKMRCVPAVRMGNIAGSWTAECPSEMKMETSSSGMGSRPTSKIANGQKTKSANKRQNSGRFWTSFLNLLLYSDRVANVFMPTALGSITSALVLKSGGKHPGIFFRPGRLFILMTERGTGIILIVLSLQDRPTSWSYGCARAMELIAGSWFVLTHCATNRDRLRVGMSP